MNSDGEDCNPFMSAKVCEKRLKFAMDNENRNWSKVMFSDQKVLVNDFFVGDTIIHEFILAAWGSISQTGDVNLVFMPDILNTEKYIEILENVMLPSVNFENVAFYQVYLHSANNNNTLEM